MAKLNITIACDSYDYLQPLKDGRVTPEGIDLNLVTVESGIRHQRMYRYGEYDACEFSMSSYLVARSQDIDWFQAIPFFTRRMFGHKFCFVRLGTDIQAPADLKSKKIGIRSYENTLALMVKGMFMEDYNLPVDSVTWVCTNSELVGSKPGPNIKIEHVDGGEGLEDLLLAGEVAAEVEPDLPRGWLEGVQQVERLFPDFTSAERAYYQKTHVFPIMHPVVVKKDILDQHPWVATSLYEAFNESFQMHRQFMQQPHRLSFAFARSYLEEERQFFGRDPYIQGLALNRHDLEAMIDFADKQGMLARPLTPEELFAENTRNT
jgi:4,5-dihydroxyphthalate decarboxylase